jgi:hypothetical protein
VKWPGTQLVEGSQLIGSSMRGDVKKRVSCKSAAVNRKTLCVIFGMCNSVRLL